MTFVNEKSAKQNCPVVLRINMYYNNSVEVMKTTAKELLKLLKENGWYIERIHGSHHILKHKDIKKLIVLPLHNTDMKPGILSNILHDAGLK